MADEENVVSDTTETVEEEQAVDEVSDTSSAETPEAVEEVSDTSETVDEAPAAEQVSDTKKTKSRRHVPRGERRQRPKVKREPATTRKPITRT
jgi:hypothetical protein